MDGIPYFNLSVGEHIRPAVMTRATKDSMTFRYIVQRDDHDADGLGFADDAIELVNGSSIISPFTGQPVELTVEEWAIDNDDFHKVRHTTRSRRPASVQSSDGRQGCTRVGPPPVLEWDGTPIRVDIVDNFPSFVTHDDLYELLAPIGEAADAIEAQLGYRIIEMGDVIPVPAGARPGWNTDIHRYAAADPSLLPRERNQVLVFYMDDDAEFWDHVGGAPAVAFPWNGTTSFNRRTMGDWWNDRDDCCIGRWSPNGRDGQVIVHEVLHLLGFKHPDSADRYGVLMAWGSTMAPWVSGSRVHYLARKDIEVLKCVFPPGQPDG